MGVPGDHASASPSPAPSLLWASRPWAGCSAPLALKCGLEKQASILFPSWGRCGTLCVFFFFFFFSLAEHSLVRNRTILGILRSPFSSVSTGAGWLDLWGPVSPFCEPSPCPVTPSFSKHRRFLSVCCGSPPRAGHSVGNGEQDRCVSAPQSTRGWWGGGSVLVQVSRHFDYGVSNCDWDHEGQEQGAESYQSMHDSEPRHGRPLSSLLSWWWSQSREESELRPVRQPFWGPCEWGLWKSDSSGIAPWTWRSPGAGRGAWPVFILFHWVLLLFPPLQADTKHGPSAKAVITEK